MSKGHDSEADDVPRDRDLHAPLTRAPYSNEGMVEDTPPAAASTPRPSQRGIGAAPIRWEWWGVGLAISLALWLGLAAAFGWIG